MDVERLSTLLARFPALHILVVGDFFLDKYLIIEHSLEEISLETGLPAHQVVRVVTSPGAAGTVTSNLRAMDVNVAAVGVIGDDGEGYELGRGLRRIGVDISSLLVHPERFTPTYTKPMLREPDGTAHELSRLDIKNRASLPADAADGIVIRLGELMRTADGLIVADQVPEPECGIITARVREEIAALAHVYPDKVFTVDSRRRIGLFRDVILKPNAAEATRALYGEGEADLAGQHLVDCGAELHRRSGKPVFLTLAAEGVMAFQAGEATRVPAVPQSGPIDIVGAGDATMAGITAALCAGATVPEAALMGMLAAGVTVRQIGTTGTASRAQIESIFREVSALERSADLLGGSGRPIGPASQ